MTHPWLSSETQTFFEQTVASRRNVRHRWVTYHRDTVDLFQQRIPYDSRVLVMGCDLGHVASSLRCRERYFWDWDPISVLTPSAEAREVLTGLDLAAAKGPYDYVLLPFTLHFLNDIQHFLEALKTCLSPSTRLIIVQYNFFWAPFIKLAQKWGLRSPLPDLNWLSQQDVENLLALSGYEAISSQSRLLVPFYIPLFTPWVNRYMAPLVPFLCQKVVVTGRPLDALPAAAEPTLTIVVPARNEAGNIAPLLDRLPRLSPRCEVIFVEGHSRDHTWEEIQRQLNEHPRRMEFALQALQQTGHGKADAVRLGFTRATGDILMILDADLSVPPEDLVLFYRVLCSKTAEFVNGSRLVYRMERYAMQVFNLFFNKLFGLWISGLMGQRVKDTLCGTKGLYRRDYDRIRARFEENKQADPFGDFELLFGAAWLSLKIRDVPIRYKERTYGATNIQRFRNGWQLVRFCLHSWRWLR